MGHVYIYLLYLFTFYIDGWFLFVVLLGRGPVGATHKQRYSDRYDPWIKPQSHSFNAGDISWKCSFFPGHLRWIVFEEHSVILLNSKLSLNALDVFLSRLDWFEQMIIRIYSLYRFIFPQKYLGMFLSSARNLWYSYIQECMKAALYLVNGGK